MVQIDLTPQECWIAQQLGAARQKWAEKNGIANRDSYKDQDNTRDGIDRHTLGIAGEIALAKLTNTYPDLSVGTMAKGDIHHPRLGRVDIKTTRVVQTTELFVSTKKAQSPPDYFALVVGEMPRFYFKGYIHAGQVFQKKYLVEFSGRPVYRVPCNMLDASL